MADPKKTEALKLDDEALRKLIAETIENAGDPSAADFPSRLRARLIDRVGEGAEIDRAITQALRDIRKRES